jgi:ADP-ribose pyrophosphatase YjhB (NUDIX family)
VTEEDRLLLVQHVHPVTGEEWWVPPGGGLEATDASVFACAQREVFEETGLQVELSRIAYVREFVDREHQAHMVEFFLAADAHSGELTLRHVRDCGPDEQYVRDVRWVPKDDLAGMVVYPEMLADEFWEDLARGFPQIRYLGVQTG